MEWKDLATLGIGAVVGAGVTLHSVDSGTAAAREAAPASSREIGVELCATYHDQGTIEANPYSQSGVLATGSNTLHLLDFNGLGVVGGIDSAVETGESVRFEIEGGLIAESFTYRVASAHNGDGDALVGETLVEGFDDQGTSLGTVLATGAGLMSVTDLFGGELLTAFEVVPIETDWIRIREVCWTEAEPFCAGDLDGDGDTDVFDFNIFAPDFGCDVTP